LVERLRQNFDQPNLNCPNCYKLAAESGYVPMCKGPGGCPVEEHAADIELNNALHDFLAAKALYHYNNIPRILEDCYRRLGLLDEPEALLELEQVYHKGVAIMQKQKETQSQWQKL
jgi:hypothetical protein